jgi:Cys-tRNA(Pro) deacylase
MGVDTTVRYFEQSTATAQQAADAIGTQLGSIVKSLCFSVDGRFVIVLAAGDRMVDDRKLGARYGVGRKKVKIADPDTTIRVTGYAPGGVCPVGHPEPLPMIIDLSLQRFKTVFASAGTPYAIFPISIGDLVRISGGEVVDIVRDV